MRPSAATCAVALRTARRRVAVKKLPKATLNLSNESDGARAPASDREVALALTLLGPDYNTQAGERFQHLFRAAQPDARPDGAARRVVTPDRDERAVRAEQPHVRPVGPAAGGLRGRANLRAVGDAALVRVG